MAILGVFEGPDILKREVLAITRLQWSQGAYESKKIVKLFQPLWILAAPSFTFFLGVLHPSRVRCAAQALALDACEVQSPADVIVLLSRIGADYRNRPYFTAFVAFAVFTTDPEAGRRPEYLFRGAAAHKPSLLSSPACLPRLRILRAADSTVLFDPHLRPSP